MGIKNGHVTGFLIGLGQFSLYASHALAFWYGGKLIHDQDADFLDVMTSLMTIMMSAMIVGQSAASMMIILFFCIINF